MELPHRSEALVYVGSLYVPIAPIAPLAIAMPFFGPKCRAGRGLRALEEDIRLAQGAAVQDKGGLEPKEKLEDFLLGINWPMMIYISANHLTAVYALVVFFFLGGVCPIFGNGVSMKWQTCVWAGVVYVLSGLGITGGVHRLWSHRSYKAEFPLRVLLMLFNSCANQGTIFHWARDHRVHHLYSDTVADPHNAMNGFFYCHVGWLVTKKHPAVAAAGKGINVSDLLADPVVMFSDDLSPVVFCFNWDSFSCKWLCSCVVVGFAWVLELVDFSALGLVGGRLSSSGHVPEEDGPILEPHVVLPSASFPSTSLGRFLVEWLPARWCVAIRAGAQCLLGCELCCARLRREALQRFTSHDGERLGVPLCPRRGLAQLAPRLRL